MSTVSNPEPEPLRRAEPNEAMLTIDGEMEPGPFQSAETEDRQARGIGSASRVHHNPLIEFQAEWRTALGFISPPRFVPMQPDIGVMERCGEVVNADSADLRRYPA